MHQKYTFFIQIRDVKKTHKNSHTINKQAAIHPPQECELAVPTLKGFKSSSIKSPLTKMQIKAAKVKQNLPKQSKQHVTSAAMIASHVPHFMMGRLRYWSVKHISTLSRSSSVRLLPLGRHNPLSNN